MAVQDKFADEMLSDDELNGVAGGTVTQLDELTEAIGDVSFVGRRGQPRAREKLGTTWYVKVYLKKVFNVDANIFTGFLGSGLFSSDNTYYRDGVELTHEEVLAMCKGSHPTYLPKDFFTKK